MLIPNHPHDERLSALASADADAVGDLELTSHVDACARCSETVTGIGALRASLADLPDLRPSRPLRLLPDANPQPASRRAGDRWTDWVRRVFAPLATAGATLALVGLVGTTMQPLTAGIFQEVGNTLEAGDAAGPEAEAPAAGEDAGTEGGAQPLATADGAYGVGAEGNDRGGDGDPTAMESDEQRAATDDHEALTTLPAERSPWPMVLFTGVALLVGALLLRWIVVPRAG
jgi:hypothetical protein